MPSPSLFLPSKLSTTVDPNANYDCQPRLFRHCRSLSTHSVSVCFQTNCHQLRTKLRNCRHLLLDPLAITVDHCQLFLLTVNHWRPSPHPCQQTSTVNNRPTGPCPTVNVLYLCSCSPILIQTLPITMLVRNLGSQPVGYLRVLPGLCCDVLTTPGWSPSKRFVSSRVARAANGRHTRGFVRRQGNVLPALESFFCFMFLGLISFVFYG